MGVNSAASASNVSMPVFHSEKRVFLLFPGYLQYRIGIVGGLTGENQFQAVFPVKASLFIKKNGFFRGKSGRKPIYPHKKKGAPLFTILHF